MRELRPHLSEAQFVRQVREQQEAGYQIAFIASPGKPVAVAGYRIAQNLAWGRFLYVDDLVTLASERSKGYGAALLSWLEAQTQQAGCRQLHLDSGVEKVDAHRFYDREGMTLSCYHYRIDLSGNS
jgi:GNAT superfamily N-acetyltransferase